LGDTVLYIVAAAWLYVVLMMSITERSVAAGLGTFVFYGVFPLSVVLYLLATPSRRRAAKARAAERLEALRRQNAAPDSAADPDDGAQVVNDPPVTPERIEPR
jgi:small-conductance mechanosensitive channel